VSAAKEADFRRILLTGGSGFVGGRLGPAIAAAFPLARHVNLTRAGDAGGLPGWENIAAPLLDRTAIADLVMGLKPDLIVHLAAQASVGAALNGAEETWRVNFGGTLDLASACAAHAPGATFMFVSSSEVYGRSFLNGPATETSPLQPTNPYARSKAAAEAMLPDILRADQRLIIVRPFNHTGPGQDERFVLPSFAAQIARIEAGANPQRLEVGNLDAEREFLDVDDVCRAYLSLLRAAPTLQLRETFNVSANRAFVIGELLQRLRTLSKAKFDIVVDHARVRTAEIPRVMGDSHRLRAATGWTSQTDIDALLHSLLESKRRLLRDNAGAYIP
jgi:GDP-4-dehydro-6-deoxy-D-mannose reductase